MKTIATLIVIAAITITSLYVLNHGTLIIESANNNRAAQIEVMTN